MDKVCARPGCGVLIQGSPSYVRKRKYCSQACNAMVNFGIKGKDVWIDEASPIDKKAFEEGWAERVILPIEEVKKMCSEERAIDTVKQEPSEHEIWLAGIRKSIKQTGHAYKYDSGGLVVGEYDVDGNLKEY